MAKTSLVNAPSQKKLVLASASRARRALLQQAGLEFEAVPADLDELAIIAACPAKKNHEALARELAARKALHVCAAQPCSVVIGADQILSCEGRLYSKAPTPGQARENLKSLRGKTHQLISAVCVAENEKIIWEHAQTARLTMKNFDDSFFDKYCEAAGAALTRAVGGYELESHGSWLFEKVDGDYFTILGLPLLPLLSFLEKEGFAP